MGIKLDQQATNAAVAELAESRGVSEDELWQVIAESLESAYRRLPGAADDAEVQIDLDSMEISVVSYETGSPCDVTPEGFGRIAAGVFRGAVSGRVSDMLRTRAAARFAGRVGTLVTGKIKHVSERRAIVEIEGVEGTLPRGEMGAGERYDIGDDVTAVVLSVRDGGDDVLVLSRASRSFIDALLAEHVPGIGDGSVVVTGFAREPGRRTKIVVETHAVDGRARLRDAVAAVVGVGGRNIYPVADALGRERIDVIGRCDDAAEFVAALTGVPATAVSFNADAKHFELVVAGDQVRQTLGIAGSNLRLAEQIIGVPIRIAQPAAA